MLLNFFKAYKPNDHGDVAEIRDLRLISYRYLSTDFKYDIIPLLPLQFIHLKNHRERLFYLLKVVRLKYGSNIINHRSTVKLVKKIFHDH